MKKLYFLKSKIAAIFLCLLMLPQVSRSQCGADINFNTGWQTYGANQDCNDCDNGGKWEVFNSGKNVRQVRNGGATFFVSDQEFIDVTIHGTFRINTATDDDWVGFVFGYKDPLTSVNNRQQFYLFDWKQAEQVTTDLNGGNHGMAREGFCLMKIDDNVDFTQIGTAGAHNTKFKRTYWAHIEDLPTVERLDSLYGSQYGWPENTDIDFSLTYTTKKIIITIDEDTIFNIDGCFEPGKFGFYNLSQNASEYKDFSYELIPDFDAAITEGCMNVSTNFSAINSVCQDAQDYESPIQTWDWDFGDGTTASGNNVAHTFEDPGTYNVKLTVGNGAGCNTSITKPFVVKGLKISADKTYLCASDQVTLTATNITGATYNWYKDDVFFQTTGMTPELIVTSTGKYEVEITGATNYDCNTASNEITITDGVPAVSVTASKTTICSGASVTLTATSYPGATYTWYRNGVESTDATNGAGNELTATQTGDFTVKVETANGCEATSSVTTIGAGTNPTASISADQSSICPYESASLTATHSGTTFSWYRNSVVMTETANPLSVNQSGTYKIVSQTADGCTGTSNEITITIKSLPNVNITSSGNLCPDQTITLTVAQTGANSYSWFKDDVLIGGADQRQLSVSDPGAYKATVVGSNSCEATSSDFEVIEYSNPVASFTSSGTEFCEGTEITLTATTVSGATYQWYVDGALKKSGSQNFYDLDLAGDVYVKVTKDGCSSNSEAATYTQLESPDATYVASVTSICPSSTSLLAVNEDANATYEWFVNSVSQGAGTHTFEISAAGSYYVKIDNGNCEASSSVLNVTTKALPSSLGGISGEDEYCQGDDMDFMVNQVSNVTTYTWSVSPSSAATIGAGQGTNTVDINFKNPTGNVTVTCTPSNECASGTPVSMQITPSTFCFGQLLFGASKTYICKGESVTFTAYSSPDFNTAYRWEFETGSGISNQNGTSTTVTFNQAGEFDVTLVEFNTFGGFDMREETKTSYIVVEDNVNTAVIDGEANPVCNNSYTYTITNGVSNGNYQWTVPSNAQIISGQNTPSVVVYFNASGNGNIQATLPGAVSCQATPGAKAVAATCGEVTSVQNQLYSQLNLKLVPNPANSFVRIESGISLDEPFEVRITNELGETVLTDNYELNKELRIESLPAGIYFIHLSGEGIRIPALKFVKW